MFLNSGIPDLTQCEALVQSPYFREIESCSNHFIAANESLLAAYRRRWVRDPLHQWSRQWEYPYAFSRIEAYAGERDGPLEVLDAGSGITFFPYMLSARWPRMNVTCCDRDPVLEVMYAKVNERAPEAVRFSAGDIGRSPFEDDSFDIIYCISVIEHLDEYREALQDFSRILKPGGRLVLSFDIALDGVSEIVPARAQALLDSAREFFEPEPGFPDECIERLLEVPEILTTTRVQRMDATLLPWGRFSPRRLKPLLRLRPPSIPELTVFCGAFKSRKRPETL